MMGRAVAAEFSKARSLRSTAWTPLSMIPLVIGIAAYVAATGSLQPDDTVLGGSLTGAALGQYCAAIFGVLLICGEYSSGMIRASLAAMPRRLEVLLAKAAVAAPVASGAALLAGLGAYGVGSWLLDGSGHADGGPFPALLAVSACVGASALLGLAVGTLVRHTAGAITAVLAFLTVPPLIAPLFGDYQGWVSGASPQVVLQKIAQSSDATAATSGSLGPWASLCLVILMAVGALAVAGIALVRRDA